MSCAVGAATPEIDPAAVLEHIKVLASDDLRGRANGSPELERAGNYIAAEFKEAGLRPAEDGDWFQPFELNTGIAIGNSNSLVVRSDALAARFSLGESYFPLAITSSDRSSDSKTSLSCSRDTASRRPRSRYDDYKGLDVKGKAVLIFSHEPQENRTDSRLNGAGPFARRRCTRRPLAARTHGAVALLVGPDPSHETDEANYRAFLADPDVDDHAIPVLRCDAATWRRFSRNRSRSWPR